MGRSELEVQAAAILELRRRQLSGNTVYGIYDNKRNLLRCWQHNGTEYSQVKAEPVVKLPLKLEKFLTTHKRFKIAFGGRGAAKSYTFGDIFLSRAKDDNIKTACFREMQNSIEDSVHALLKAGIKRIGYQNFTVTNNAIQIDSHDVFKFRGLSRNSDAVKSMSGFKMAWIEEAQALSYESIKDLTPTFREPGSEMWFSLNPQSSEDPISKRFLKPFESQMKAGYYEDDLHLIVKMDYLDNPWFPEELEQERLWDHENLDRALYDHIWLGAYNDHVDDALIRADWFDYCIDAHTKLGFNPEGVIIAAHDPADTGGDNKGYALRHGSVFLDVDEMLNGDVNTGSDWASRKALDSRADVYTWDSDGMGVALSRQVDQAFTGKHTQLVMFKGSESPDFPDAIYNPSIKTSINDQKTNKDSFRNKRAQYYFILRDRIYKTYRAVKYGEYSNPDDLISFSTGIKQLSKLKSELCRIPVKPNLNGKLELYTKDEMKSRFKIESPGMADSVMMSMRYINIVQHTNFRPKPIRRMVR